MAAYAIPILDSNGMVYHPSETKQGPSAEQWARLQPVIKTLYIEEGRTLKDVMRIMADKHGHIATVKIYKSRLTRWEFDKYNRPSDMAFVVRKKRAHEAQGKRSMFMVRSREVAAQEIDRYVARKQMKDEAFEEAPADEPTPIHVLCFSPPCIQSPACLQGALMVSDEDSAVQMVDKAISIDLGKRKRRRSPSPASHSGLSTQAGYRRVRAWAQSPGIHRPIPVPNVLGTPEMLFRDISCYVMGSLSNGSWCLTLQGRLRRVRQMFLDPVDFLSLCIDALHFFDEHSAVQGRRLLSKAFSLLPALLREEHPELLRILIVTIFEMSRRGFREIHDITQDFIAKLARTILPKQHSLHRLCVSISYARLDHEEVELRSLRCLKEDIEHVSRSLSYSSITTKVEVICTTHAYSDFERAELLLRKLLADYELTTKKLENAAIFILCELASLMLDQDKDEEVEILLEDTLLQFRQRNIISVFGDEDIHHLLAVAQHNQYVAEENIRSAVAFFVERFGKSYPFGMCAYRHLEIWLRVWGRMVEADQILADMDEIIGSGDIETDDTACNASTTKETMIPAM